MKYSTLFSIIRVVALLCLPSAVSAEPTYRELCHNGEALLAGKRYDSSSTVFLKAYAAGMPAESLYYFWGETYRSRSVLDSALALNFAAGRTAHEKIFVRRILEQRYRLYDALEWDEARDAVEDSLAHQFARRNFIPDVQVVLDLGYENLLEAVDTTSVWSGETDPEVFSAGLAYRAALKMKWIPSVALRNHLRIGLNGNIDKPYWTGVQSKSLDSASLTGSVFAELLELFDHGGVAYEASIRRYYNGESEFGHSADVSYTALGKKTLFYLMLGYSSSLLLANPKPDRSVYLLDYYGRNIGQKSFLGIVANVSGYFAPPLHFIASGAQGLTFFVEDVTADTLRWFTDETFTTAATPDEFGSLLPSIPPDSMVFSKTLPQTMVSIGPETKFRTKLGEFATIGLGVGYTFKWFPQCYEWVDGPPLYRAALNAADEEYYWITDGGPQNEGGLLGEPSAVAVFGAIFDPPQIHREVRRDHQLSLLFTAGHIFKKAGTLDIFAEISRTWSSLHDRAPMEIPVRAWSVKAQWSRTFSVDRTPWNSGL